MCDDDAQITLQCEEGQDFVTSGKVAKLSATIKNLIEDAGIDNAIPLPNVKAAILTKVLEFCEHQVAQPKPVAAEEDAAAKDSKKEKTQEEKNAAELARELSEWDTAFVAVDRPTLFEMILAANYLDIPDMLFVTCKTVANSLKGKTPEQIREMYNIVNDLTPEEAEQIRKENEWCEER